MELVQILLIALAMSVDALSVSMCASIAGYGKWLGVKLALTFGFFQFFMPLLGAFTAFVLEKRFVGDNLNYLAGLILVGVAVKIFFDGRSGTKTSNDGYGSVKILLLALATSIDAYCVGLPVYAMDVNILLSTIVIGVICAMLTYAGFRLGRLIVGAFSSKAHILSAAILILLGVKFFFE
jgi:putative Mn2+ efflux pump MntP